MVASKAQQQAARQQHQQHMPTAAAAAARGLLLALLLAAACGAAGQQATQFLPQDVPSVARNVTARLVFRQLGLMEFVVDPFVDRIVLQNKVVINGPVWRASFASTGGTAVLGAPPNASSGGGKPSFIVTTDPLQPGSGSSSGGSLHFSELPSLLLVGPGSRLVFERTALSGIANTSSYAHSAWAPWGNAGVGYPLWPTIDLAPNASLMLSNVSIIYADPSTIDTCEQYTAKVVYGMRQQYGADSVVLLNETAGQVLTPLDIRVIVTNGSSSEEAGEASARLDNVTFVCLPRSADQPAAAAQAGLTGSALAAAIAVPVAVAVGALLAGLLAWLLVRRRRRRQRKRPGRDTGAAGRSSHSGSDLEAPAAAGPAVPFLRDAPAPSSSSRDQDLDRDDSGRDKVPAMLPGEAAAAAAAAVAAAASLARGSSRGIEYAGASAATSSSSAAAASQAVSCPGGSNSSSGGTAAMGSANSSQPSLHTPAAVVGASPAVAGSRQQAGQGRVVPTHSQEVDAGMLTALPSSTLLSGTSTGPQSSSERTSLEGGALPGQQDSSGGSSASAGGARPGSGSQGASGDANAGLLSSRGGSPAIDRASAGLPALLKARSDAAVLRDLKIGPLLGRGSYGRVYKGRWKAVTVAVKIIEHSEGGVASSGNKRINVGREAMLATNILHPNVVQTYHISTMSISQRNALASSWLRESGAASSSAAPGSVPAAMQPAPEDGVERSSHSQGSDTSEEEGRELLETWLIMEYCEKGSLDRAISQGTFVRRSNQQPEMIGIYKALLDTASGLDYLHSLGIVHGDLKTANVLLKGSTRDVRGFACKITDFGLSRVLDLDATHVSTRTYGTIVYMPSELLLTGRMTTATDIYSFGLMMWELFTSQRVVEEGISIGQIFYMIAYQNWRPTVPPSCPPGYAQLMAACWHEDPAQRPTVQQLLRSLQQLYVAEKQGLAAAKAAAAAAAAAVAGEEVPAPSRVSFESTASDRYRHAVTAATAAVAAVQAAEAIATSPLGSPAPGGSADAAGAQPGAAGLSGASGGQRQSSGDAGSTGSGGHARYQPWARAVVEQGSPPAAPRQQAQAEVAAQQPLGLPPGLASVAAAPAGVTLLTLTGGGSAEMEPLDNEPLPSESLFNPQGGDDDGVGGYGDDLFRRARMAAQQRAAAAAGPAAALGQAPVGAAVQDFIQAIELAAQSPRAAAGGGGAAADGTAAQLATGQPPVFAPAAAHGAGSSGAGAAGSSLRGSGFGAGWGSSVSTGTMPSVLGEQSGVSFSRLPTTSSAGWASSAGLPPSPQPGAGDSAASASTPAGRRVPTPPPAAHSSGRAGQPGSGGPSLTAVSPFSQQEQQWPGFDSEPAPGDAGSQRLQLSGGGSTGQLQTVQEHPAAGSGASMGPAAASSGASGASGALAGGAAGEQQQEPRPPSGPPPSPFAVLAQRAGSLFSR